MDDKGSQGILLSVDPLREPVNGGLGRCICSVGDDEVQAADSLRGELLDGLGRVGLGRRVDLHDHQPAVLALRQVCEIP